MFGIYHSTIYRYKILSPSRKMDTVSPVIFTIAGIVYGIVFTLGALALLNKDKLYGSKYGSKLVIFPVLLFTLITVTFGAGLIYIQHAYLLTDDSNTQQSGIKYFIGVAATLFILGGVFTNYILHGQGIINVQGFNLFSSFLVLEFSVMAVLTVIISKVWTLNV